MLYGKVRYRIGLGDRTVRRIVECVAMLILQGGQPSVENSGMPITRSRVSRRRRYSRRSICRRDTKWSRQMRPAQRPSL
jgi:hypothetical protein